MGNSDRVRYMISLTESGIFYPDFDLSSVY